MDNTAIFFLVFFASVYVFFIVLEIVSYYSYWHKHKNFVDDGKEIPNQTNMITHCKVVHTGIPLYQYLDCAICVYKEECEKYELRYKHYPNGMVDSRRKNNEDKGE